MTKDKSIYALLVGIDLYPAGIPTLSGCVNDINAINNLLDKDYSPYKLQIIKLENEAATRQNIINGFKQHLSKARTDDTVLFYYSGHGSRENAPSEFWDEFPNRKNETLVCYDSRIEGGFDLADKEIAVLLSELALHCPHIVVCLDSCHSGSGTRESVDLVGVRQVEKEGNYRSLESYVDGYYSNQIKNTGKISVPTPKHLLLSACQEDEKAYETKDKHGLFTTNLLGCLSQKQNTSITYAELYQRLSINVRTTQKTQHPNFEYLGGFNPHTIFLTGVVSDRIRTFPIFYDAEAKKWKAGKGNIHGISNESIEEIKIWIFDINNSEYTFENCIGETYLTNVSTTESTIKAIENLDIHESYIGFQVNGGKKYASVYSELSSNGLPALSEYQVVEAVDKESADYWIISQNTLYTIIHRASNKIIAESGDLSVINTILQKTARWENIKKLKNSQSRIREISIQTVFNLLDDFDEIEQSFENNEVELSLKQYDDGSIETKKYSISVNNSSGKELHFKLIFISPLYGIMQLGSAIVPNGQSGVLKDIGKLGFFPEQVDDLESNCIFKIVASTKEIDLSFFEQSNFSLNLSYVENNSRGGSRFLDEMGIGNSEALDWTTKDIKLRLVKSNAAIGQNKVELSNGQIVIQPHKTLKAKVSFTNIYDASRGNFSKETILKSASIRHGVSLLSFEGGTKSTISPQLIELQEIEGDISVNDPLIITVVNSTIEQNEILFPVVVDGDNLLVIGNSQTTEKGKSEVYIERLPELETQGANTKNLGRAIKFCLMKLVFKATPDNFFLLRWVDFDEDKPTRKIDKIKEKVSNADTILLLVHGIIGDTEGMIPFVETITKSTANPDGKYDLALTFDYECLSTPIEQIAVNLIKTLEAVGISDTTGKKVTIIAHSMGGLVSRVMIEKNRKEMLVDKLIMAGTPNGGSVLGKVPSYLALASDVLTLGLGAAFIAPYLSWAAGLVVALKKSDKLTVTLAQMKQDSDFIRELRTYTDPKVPYYILAGRIDRYELLGSSWFEKLGKKLALVGGNIFHKGEIHDIAVYTIDIEAVDDNRNPKPIKKEIGCPHILYYDEPASTAIMYEWLEK